MFFTFQKKLIMHHHLRSQIEQRQNSRKIRAYVSPYYTTLKKTNVKRKTSKEDFNDKIEELKMELGLLREMSVEIKNNDELIKKFAQDVLGHQSQIIFGGFQKDTDDNANGQKKKVFFSSAISSKEEDLIQIEESSLNDVNYSEPFFDIPCENCSRLLTFCECYSN